MGTTSQYATVSFYNRVENELREMKKMGASMGALNKKFIK